MTRLERRSTLLPASLVLATLLMACGKCFAQTPNAAPRDALRPTTVLLAPDRLTTPGMPKPAPPPMPDLGASATSASVNARAYDVLGSYVQLEMPRDLGDGTYTRPKLRLGMQSEALKSWATSVGMQPERCTLPTLRSRSRVTSDEVSGTVIVMARCSFY
ncbi:MAG: hypothetical protein ACREBN_02230 [Burkholderiaceae bacterium]